MKNTKRNKKFKRRIISRRGRSKRRRNIMILRLWRINRRIDIRMGRNIRTRRRRQKNTHMKNKKNKQNQKKQTKRNTRTDSTHKGIKPIISEKE